MKILKCCKLNLMQWRIQPKFLLMLVFYLLHILDRMWTFRVFLQANDLKAAPWTLPALLGYNKGQWYLIAMLAFIFIICDAPFLNRQQQLVLQRVGKRQWISGQLLYLVVLSFLFALVTWLCTWVFLLPEVEWTTQWGVGIQSATRNLNSFAVRPGMIVESAVLKNWSAPGATAWVFLMQFLTGIFLGELVLVLNLWARRGIGVCIAIFLTVLSFTIRHFEGMAGYVKHLVFISPVNWTDLTMVGDAAEKQPSLLYCVSFLLIFIVGLATLAITTIHRCNLDIDKE